MAEGLSENTPSGKRWYDKDPVLASALEQLRQAPDKYQAQIALNIIKIIVEHQVAAEADCETEDLLQLCQQTDSPEAQGRSRRWYDVNETLSSAIQLLSDCPDDLQAQIIPSIALMIEQTLSRTENTG